MGLALTHNKRDKVFIEGRGKKLELIISDINFDDDYLALNTDILIKGLISKPIGIYLVRGQGSFLIMDDFEIGISGQQFKEYSNIKLYYEASKDYRILRERVKNRKYKN